ncbi:MAG: hypothetical protein ACFE8L_06270 [Candidatus Hodarchaeota archaeon]
MTDLHDLTVYYLEKLAKECNISLKKNSTKAEKIKQIKKANISREYLKKLVTTFLGEKEQSKTNRSSKRELETRITKLEEQVKLLTSTLSELKRNSKKVETGELIEEVSNLDDVKRTIISMIDPGKSLTIDELIEIKEIQQYPLSMITRAIIDLIKEEVLIGAEGNSIQKIGGRIGILIRK